MPSGTDAAIASWLELAEHGGHERLERLWSAVGPQHVAIRDALAGLMPASVLEVGSSVGVNLAAAAELGCRECWGVELDPEAVAFAARALPGIFIVGDLRRALEPFRPRAWDVTIACYTLAYVSPEEILHVLETLHGVTARALILAEPQDPLVYAYPVAWSHPYADLLPVAGFDLFPTVTPIDGPNGLTTVEVWRR